MTDGRWEVREGNCLEVLRTLPDASVDVVITDPPYGDTSLAWDVRVAGWLPLVARVLKPSGSLWCFGSMRFFMEQAGAFDGWRYAQDVVWEKHNGSGFADDRFKRVHEHIVQFYPRGAAWGDIYKEPIYTADATARTMRRNKQPTHTGHIEASAYASHEGGPRLMRSVISARSCHGYAIHPTQKPVELLVWLIRYSCPPGGLVLDPFAGSASTGEAALQEGRRFVGIELDASYHRAASDRLMAVAAQGQLFAGTGVGT